MSATAAQDSSGDFPRHSAPLTSRVSHHDEQFQRHQPFYIPNNQPLLPYQWPVSNPYMPYHGLGYGMMMPPFLFPPCLELPGYMFPPAQMLDYRRLTNPLAAPNITQQPYRFRHPSVVPSSRVMVSSEVQTEPTSLGSRQDSHTGSESGRGTGCDSPASASASASFSENKSIACPDETPVFTHSRVVSTNTINTSDTSAVRKNQILLQTERVQIKRSETPSRLKFVENADQDGGDLLQCSLGSMRSEDVVLCSYQSLAFRKEKQKMEPGNPRYLPAKVRMSPSCVSFKVYPKSNVPESFDAHRCSVIRRTSNTTKEDENSNSCNVGFKILRLPFDKQTGLLEASIWSVESMLPYVPSGDWLIKNGLVTPRKTPRNDADHLETCRSTKSLRRDRRKSNTPYRPSSSWLADLGNVYYYSKLPSLQQNIGGFGLSPEKHPHKETEDKLDLISSAHENKTRNQRSAVKICNTVEKRRSFHSCNCTSHRSPRCFVSDWVSRFSLEEKIPRCSCKSDIGGRAFAPNSLCCRREDISRTKHDVVRAHDTQQMVVGNHLSHQTKLDDLCEDCRCHGVSSVLYRCDVDRWSDWEEDH